MFRSKVWLVAVSGLAASACVGSPAVAPPPVDADPGELQAVELQQECRSARDRVDCYSQGLLRLLEREGVTAAMFALEELGERDASVRREGHMYAHHIGLAASPSPDSVDETFRQCRPSFQSGCYHGVIQAYFADLTSAGAEIDAEVVNGLCADYRENEADRWLLFQCVHGLGHGLTMLHDYHLPTALEGCDLLASDWDRQSCYGGVFMESIVNATTPHHAVGRPHVSPVAGAHADGQAEPVGEAEHAEQAGQVERAERAGHGAHAEHVAQTEHAGHAGHANQAENAAHAEHAAAGHQPGGMEAHQHHGGGAVQTASREPFPPLDPDQPLYPCTVLEERYLIACYQMQTSAILYFNGGDIAATARACDQAPERYRGQCYLSLGRDISGITVQDHDRARRACSVGDPEYAVWCHIGYVKNLVDLTADPLDALEYCRGAEGDRLKQACYHAVGEEIWVLTSDRQQGEDWCALAEQGHVDNCRRGAGLVSWREVAAG